MFHVTKFLKNLVNVEHLSERQKNVYILLKRHCSEVKSPEQHNTKQDETEFRVLKIKPSKITEDKGKKQNIPVLKLEKEAQYKEDVDWTNVWVGPKSFDPYMVPIPLKQGYVEKSEIPGKHANAELMKIPNFLHLTPPAIEKHCNALKKFCTKWPEELDTEKIMEKHFPITIITSDYCHSSPSIRDPLSRIVSLKINIEALEFDKHAKDKFLRLVGDRYNHETGDILLIAENCPLKKQNYDHAMYILTALCFESWKIEKWEELKTIEDMTEYCFNLRKTKKNLEAHFNYTGKPYPSLEKVGEILTNYIEKNKEVEMINSLKEEVLNLLNLPKFG